MPWLLRAGETESTNTDGASGSGQQVLEYVDHDPGIPQFPDPSEISYVSGGSADRVLQWVLQQAQVTLLGDPRLAVLGDDVRRLVRDMQHLRGEVAGLQENGAGGRSRASEQMRVQRLQSEVGELRRECSMLRGVVAIQGVDIRRLLDGRYAQSRVREVGEAREEDMEEAVPSRRRRVLDRVRSVFHPSG